MSLAGGAALRPAGSRPRTSSCAPASWRSWHSCCSLIALPLATLAVEELPGRRGALRRPRQLRALLRDADAGRLAVEQLWVAALSTAIVVPLAFLYAYGLTRTCMPAKGLFVALALLPLFAPSLLLGHLAHLHLRQPGLPEELADGRQRLRADRHRAGAGVLLLPACADDPDHRPFARRRAALRGGRGDGHAALARVLDGDAAGRALRPDLGRCSSSSRWSSPISASPR